MLWKGWRMSRRLVVLWRGGERVGKCVCCRRRCVYVGNLVRLWKEWGGRKEYVISTVVKVIGSG